MMIHSNSCAEGDGEDEEAGIEKMREMFGPGHVDQAIRSAIQACWMVMPKERRNVAEVGKEIRRLVERALANFREDAESFGKAK